MPLVRIDLMAGKPNEYLETIGQVIYDALMTCIGVPADDRFQIFTEHAPHTLKFDRSYLGIERSDDCIFIQVTLSRGRDVEKKQAFYEAVANGLNEQLSVRKEDVFLNLVEVGREDWSFGNGIAQYVPPA